MEISTSIYEINFDNMQFLGLKVDRPHHPQYDNIWNNICQKVS